MTENYLLQLNGQQRDAVEYTSGPELVIAGAGSGKTRVLTYKIVHLLYNGFVPWRILALTFTNKAAREMKERIEGLTGTDIASRLWMGTFHSIFARILRLNADQIGYKSNFTIYDTSDSKALVKMIIKELQLDEKIYKPSTVLGAISSAKNALVSPEKYRTLPDVMEADRSCKRPLIHEIYQMYVDRCISSGAMDFDDLLYNTYCLLRDCPDVLRHYREYFQYVLVDEYQDTNFAQHTIVQMLTEGKGNVCVVGDDAQSIYSFRGASIGNILNLNKAYPDLETFKLEQNYRSTQNIINAANSLIAKNVRQIPKTVFSRNNKGSLIEVVKCYSDLEEASIVASRISRLKMSTGDSYNDFAILYRTNAQSRQLEESLRKRNIAYRIWGGLSFYQRKEVRDAIAYFRLTVNPDDDEALRRIINYPLRGIGETTVKKLSHCAVVNNVSIWQVLSNPEQYEHGISKATWRKLNDFRFLIEGFSDKFKSGKYNAYELSDMIIGGSGIRSELISENTPETISRRENLSELVSSAREFVDEHLRDGDDHVSLQDFLQQASLATDQDKTDDGNSEMVTLMTVHASKGLEFGNIFIVGTEDELFPSAMANDTPENFEEERRLLYVAMTRAKRFCMMSYATSRYRNGQRIQTSPSPFLKDIDREYLSISDSSDIGKPKNDPIDRYLNSFHTPSFLRSDKPTIAKSSGKPDSGSTASKATVVKNNTGSVSYNGKLLHVGQRFEHRTLGQGVIKDIDTSQPDVRIVVMIDGDNDTKTLMLKFAKLNLLD